MPDRSVLVEKAQTVLSAIRGKELSLDEMCARSLELAPVLQQLCELESGAREREQAQVLARMMRDKRGQVFTTLLTDRAYRSASKKRTVEQARYLLEKVGAPNYVGPLDQAGLGALRSVGAWLPTLTGTAMLNRIRHESSAFILPDNGDLDEYLRRCKKEAVAINVNHLGEEVLGEAEAENRTQGYIALLRRPDIDTLSVKISSIASQLDALAFDASVDTVSTRLERIYQAAIEHASNDGSPKRVVLDMEAYDDVELTLAAFQRTLERKQFLTLPAGIALQAYLPETLQHMSALLTWSRSRIQQGGAPVRVRLVKGANLAVERVESELHGWRSPIFSSKALVDANFKRVLLLATEPQNLQAAHLGVGSHNLFDVCFALVLRSSRQVEAHVSFELLHGMAEPMRRALQRLGAQVLVYAPIVGEHEFPSAIAYLVRRLDENTAAENYLRHSFGMKVDSDAWREQTERFRTACDEAGHSLHPVPQRGTDRNQPQPQPPRDGFANEPDTDFSLGANRRWIEQHLTNCGEMSEVGDLLVCGRVSGKPIASGERAPGFDPSRPGLVPYEIALMGAADVDAAIGAAAKAERAIPPVEQRVGWLRAAAVALRQARGELIALMVLDAGKRVREADIEVSEAIDFAEYYSRCYEQLVSEARTGATNLQPRGLVVVTPPWNFPLAIPLGGVFAALVAGNPVILKPALETPLVAQRACELLWQAGVPEDWLQLAVCGDEIGSLLITDERSKAVILTGGTSTAQRFMIMRPALKLFAETGGKNALYVSEMSDHEQAIADVVRSAFGHAGQKCSALSQLILHQELHASDAFLAVLKDACESLAVGSAWELDTVVTPLIQPPSELQRKALTTLAPGERWLVEPRLDAHNSRLVSPGIKMGVAPGSESHTTEYFCPLLSVLAAGDVREAVTIANATPYGLTAGIHSLDEREHDYFIEHMQAGNLYINRSITGAVVQRQPFGGWKSSSFGPGAKAGGPNYVAQFVKLVTQADRRPLMAAEQRLPRRVERILQQVADVLDEEQQAALRTTANLYVRTHTEFFAGAFDPSQVRGEDNLLQYRPLRGMVVVENDELPPPHLAALVVAAVVAECPIEIMSTQTSLSKLAQKLDAVQVTNEELLQHLESSQAEHVRSVRVDEPLRELLNRRNISLSTAAPLSLPRQELFCFLREQAVSVRYHRYGYLGLRELHVPSLTN